MSTVTVEGSAVVLLVDRQSTAVHWGVGGSLLV